MVCQGIEIVTNATIGTFLAYPTSCDAQYYAKIMGALFIIITFLIFEAERRSLNSDPDFISAMGISSLAVLFLTLIGSFLGIISTLVFIELFVIGGFIIAIWLLKK